MKRLLRGSVVLAAAIGFLSCSGDPTSDFRQPTGIVASPTSVFIDVGETEAVVASLVDDQGNQIAADFEISAVGPGLTVVQDEEFQNTTAGVHIDNQVRFQVTAGAIANSSFTLTAGGLSRVIPVRVTPAAIDIAISNPTPEWGDTITLTAPAGVLFTDESEVTFAGGPPGDIVSLSPDRTMLSLIPGPNVQGVATISHTTVTFDESLDFTVTSNGTVTSPPLTNLEGAVLSNPTPALGESITLTLPPGIRVLPVAVLPPTSIGAPDNIGFLADSGLIVEGAINPRAKSVPAADSSVIQFIPAPNSDSFVTVRGIVPSVLTQFPQILTTTIKVTTPRVDSLPATLSSAAPPVNTPVTLTRTDPLFTFIAPAVIGISGDSNAIVTGQTATTITFLPRPGAAGKVGVGAVDVVGFNLSLTSNAPAIAVSSTVPSAPGTDNPATAPALALPATVGATTGFYDAGTFQADIFAPDVDQVYRMVVPGAGSYRVTVDWNNDADVDVALCSEATCATAPNFAAATANHPEATTYTFTGAGTSFLVLDLFAGTAPGWVSIKITRLT